jgi:hypothetical protein
VSNGVRVVPEDELAYARERVVAWCTKPFPHMTLEQVQSLAILVAVERQKAVQIAVLASVPPRTRRLAMPITLPTEDEDDEPTDPRPK